MGNETESKRRLGARSEFIPAPADMLHPKSIFCDLRNTITRMAQHSTRRGPRRIYHKPVQSPSQSVQLESQKPPVEWHPLCRLARVGLCGHGGIRHPMEIGYAKSPGINSGGTIHADSLLESSAVPAREAWWFSGLNPVQPFPTKKNQ